MLVIVFGEVRHEVHRALGQLLDARRRATGEAVEGRHDGLRWHYRAVLDVAAILQDGPPALRTRQAQDREVRVCSRGRRARTIVGIRTITASFPM